MMREKSFLGLNPQGFHKVAYQEWGEADNPNVVLCVHGLTRNAGDFYWLAKALARKYRVICPDMVGRGNSDYFYDGSRYNYAQYMSDLNALMVRLEVGSLYWVGTSMGGLIGMMIGALSQNPIKAMVMNDIGPFVPSKGLERLAKYVPKAHVFNTFEAATHFLKSTLLGCNDLTDAQWKQLTDQSMVWDGIEKRWTVRYDPQVAATIPTKNFTDIDFWAHWDRLHMPILALQGAESDILVQSTLQQMASKARVTTHSFPKQGHALSLATEEQIHIIQEWFDALEGVAA